MSDAYIDHLNHEALESYDRAAEQGPDWDEAHDNSANAEGDDWRSRNREDTPEGGE